MKMDRFLGQQTTALVLAASFGLANQLPLLAADESGPDTTSNRPPPAITNVTAEVSARSSPAASSPAVADVLKMLEAGVSSDVIRTFAQTYTTPFEVNAGDLVTLKQRGVSDDIATALLKRASELRASAVAANSLSPAPSAGSTSLPLRVVPTYHGFDPESYGYFYHYYLHPRTLASVYQRLGSSGPFAPYPLGYRSYRYGPGPF